VEEIARNIPGSRYYHSDLEKGQRTEIEQQFGSGQVKVVVSTIALAMGFDKSDIHFVIHTYTPASAIQYYQEIGRAGRGIDRATAYLLYSQPGDLTLGEKMP
jgi:ATP-dependent DNA helicase RecQ